MVAAAKLPAHAPAEFEIVYTDDVEASPLNYRKTFNGIGELGEDIKVNGLRVPIKVRPNPRKTSKWELIYGERRWRAAQAAGVEQLPALIQSLTDEEVVKEQLIENSSREDVHPLEEADLFKRMTDEHGYERQAIADMIGKSLSHVHARMKLCDLKGKLAREAFGDDKISASIALLAARIPDGKLQDMFVKEVLEGHHAGRELVHGEWVEVKQPMSYREAQVHAQQNYMLRLENAPFPIADANLVKGVGACVGCLFRTGNQRELFDDVKSADVCTNPPCFNKKRDAQFAIDAKEHAKGGGTVLSATEAKKVFEVRDHDDSVYLPWNSKYKKADEQAPWEIDKKRRSWSELFGGEDKVPVILAKDPTGETWKLIDVGAATKALEKQGVLAKPKKSSGSRKSGPAKPKEPKAEELIEPRVQKKILRELVDKIDAKAAQHDIAFWRWIADSLFNMAFEGTSILKQARNFAGSSNDIGKTLLRGAKTGSDFRRLAIEAVVADQIGLSCSEKDPIGDAIAACKIFKVDWEEIILDATDEVKKELEERKAKAAAAKKPAKKPAKKGKAS